MPKPGGSFIQEAENLHPFVGVSRAGDLEWSVFPLGYVSVLGLAHWFLGPWGFWKLIPMGGSSFG